MIERLIQLLQEYSNNNNNGGSNHGRAEYLLEHGVIVTPCKVGASVYYITGVYNSIVKSAKVEEIYFSESGFAYHVYSGNTYFTLQEDEIFYTEEAAKKALRGN